MYSHLQLHYSTAIVLYCITEQEHVVEILLSKLSDRFATFDTLLYTCSDVFDFMSFEVCASRDGSKERNYMFSYMFSYYMYDKTYTTISVHIYIMYSTLGYAKYSI